MQPTNQSPSNISQRTIVIGDLHGCYDELIDLLTTIDFGANYRVVAVGDLTVKGPKSREILDLFIADHRFRRMYSISICILFHAFAVTTFR